MCVANEVLPYKKMRYDGLDIYIHEVFGTNLFVAR